MRGAEDEQECDGCWNACLAINGLKALAFFYVSTKRFTISSMASLKRPEGVIRELRRTFPSESLKSARSTLPAASPCTGLPPSAAVQLSFAWPGGMSGGACKVSYSWRQLSARWQKRDLNTSLESKMEAGTFRQEQQTMSTSGKGQKGHTL
ncbi:hypothetical protein Baya_2091 [Bagarius yarrelli]|uniref:Uncharacterized protein n=1 Tax=Bagarius yarrelli TaxID=175774 RepID=A0A556TMZ4_BAGYA|nr:hypothetical protein Baya_2091 [Bagarius yarrelli]